MPIEVKCPGCQALLRIADENVGRKSRCPNCSHVFTAAPPQPEPSQPTESPFVAPLSDAAPPETSRLRGESSANPYAPTYSEPEPRPEAVAYRPRRITVDEVITNSWLIFKKHWTMACVVVLIVGAVNFACNIVQNLVINGLAMAFNEDLITFGAQALMSIVFWVLQIWLQLGQTMVMLDIARGRPINLSKLFAGGPYVLNGIVATLGLALIVGAIAFVLIGIPAVAGLAIAQSGEGAGVGAIVGLVIAIVPMIVLSLALSQYQPLIVDRHLSGIESLRMSYQITNGNKFTLFVIGIVLAVIGFAALIVGLLAFCIGVVPAMIGAAAYSTLVFAVAYLSMTGQPMVIPGSTSDPRSSQYSTSLP